jgi:ribonuclease P protein subunit RPR2|tara:strand:+ start:4362 stop:4676 length:315 start_codon:yes stop_codon:yes gene_type:complete
MANKFVLKKEKLKKKAQSEISAYFKLAKAAFPDKKKANLYVHKARRLSMKHNIRLSSSVKKRFCKHCYSYLVPSVNCRVRTRDKKLVYYCMECKKYMRFGLKKN